MDKSTESYFRKCIIIAGKIYDENALLFKNKKKSERF